MFDLVIVIRVAAVALLLPEILLVLRRAGRRSEAVWFAAFLGSLAVLAAVAGSRIGDVALLPTASAMLWAAGTYLDERDGRAAPWWWHVLAVLVVGGGVALAVSAVAGEVAATAAAAVVGTVAFSLYPMRRLCAPEHWGKGAADRYLCFAGAVPVLGAAYDIIAPTAGWPAGPVTPFGVLALAAGAGYFIAEGDYLRAPSWWAGTLRRYPRRVERLRRRLSAAEERLILQSRIDSIGHLAAGAAHDFKNTLSLVKLGKRPVDPTPSEVG